MQTLPCVILRPKGCHGAWSSPAGHVPLQCGVLGVPLRLGRRPTLGAFLLRLELVPLGRADVDGLEVQLVLAVLHLRARVSQDTQVQRQPAG